MTDSVNMVQLVDALPKRRRGRACVVLTRDYPGQKKWAEELSRQAGADHVNLLDRFVQNEGLADQVSHFMVDRLFDFLQGQSNKAVLIVSGMEFIKAAWSGLPNNLEEFVHRIEYWDKTPALLLVLQHDKSLAARHFTRFPQYEFVVDQKETLAL